MENRIKECQLDLLADRTSTATMAANQLRLWFSSFAYVLLEALRRIGLPHTELAQATCGTIPLKLLKLGARVTVSVRRIEIAIASAPRRVRPGACPATRTARLSRKPHAVERMTPTAAVAPVDSLWLRTTKTRRYTAKPTSPRQRRVGTQLHAPPISRRDRPDTRGSVRYPG